ncbi:angiotensin-converting enzyme-like [Musca autumnalis]|uniref:angiotensin-converting enzyme-like n=1 Tax=Musca autumnalis TaxID=221902 RepID=UPI003CF9BF1E
MVNKKLLDHILQERCPIEIVSGEKATKNIIAQPSVFQLLAALAFINNIQAECLTESCAQQLIETIDLKYRQTAKNLSLFPDFDVGAELALRNDILPLLVTMQKFDWQNFEDPHLKREFEVLLRDSKYPAINKKFRKHTSNLRTVGKQKFTCDRNSPNKCKLISYIRHIKPILTNSNNPDEIKWYWREWRNHLPQEIKNALKFYINYYRDIPKDVSTPPSTIWYERYDDPKFIENLEEYMEVIEPFYKELHAHLREALKLKYGPEVIPASDLIPHHFVEQALYQSWKKESVLPNPHQNKKMPNLLQELRGKRWKPLDLVETSGAFFESMGFPAFTEEFKRDHFFEIEDNMSGPDCKSYIFTQSEIELNYCPKVNYKKLLTTHGDIAHVEYAIMKNNLTVGLNREASPGFSNAIAEAVILSASTPKHLQQHLGLLTEYNYDDEMNLNFLFRMAVHALLSIPFYFVHEKLWVDMIDDKIKPEEYNCHYWNLMAKYMGVGPSEITDPNAFDMPYKFYEGLVEETRSTRKLFGEFLGYQIYRDICLEIGEYVPGNSEKALFKCDFASNNKAGNILKSMMSAGATKTWHEIVNATKLEGSAFLDYYAPLKTWLVEENKTKNITVGWAKTDLTFCVNIFAYIAMEEPIANHLYLQREKFT